MTAHGSQHPFEMKQRLRRDMRAKRSALDDDTRSTFDHSIRQRLQELVGEHGFKAIAAYWPFNGEPDITPLFEPWL